HSLCWSEVCWLKDNPDLELVDPNLLKYNNSEKEDFKKMLQKCFASPTQQSSASFKACHAVAILDHNEGLLRLPEKLRDFYIPLSENDIKNIEKLAL
ncbi:11011_t:CDS:2, partial [Entrophospora sp. SA101]